MRARPAPAPSIRDVAPPSAPSAPPEPAPPAPPPEPTLADLFAGDVDPNLPKMSAFHLGVGDTGGPGDALHFRLPRGWIEERMNDGTVWNGLAHPRTKTGDAKVVITSMGWKVAQPQIDVWTKFLHVTDATWGEPSEGTLGKKTYPATFATGKGKLGKDDAHLWYAVTRHGKDGKAGHVLIIAAVKDSAPEERTKETIACMKGLF
jgi:hypothetical protein